MKYLSLYLKTVETHFLLFFIPCVFFSNTRKRRGRRTVSSHLPDVEPTKTTKEEPPRVPSPPPPPTPPAVPVIHSPVKVKQEKVEIIVKQEEEVKMEVDEEVKEEEEEIKEEKPIIIKEEPIEIKQEVVEERPNTPPPPPPQEIKKEIVKEEEIKSPPPTPVSTRRSSHYKSDKEDDKPSDSKEEQLKCKKLSREERKLEAILKAIEKMEKEESRKQGHQAKQAAHRRESEPGPNNPKEDDKNEPRVKRRRRKGRARTVSQSTTRRNRLNSTDSYMTSGDENLLSPNDNSQPPLHKSSEKECNLMEQNDSNRAVGLLLALSNGDNKHEKSPPPREIDSNSNSAHSSPETPLSSACLLVQAAVEPLEPGFKFPKTKKVLMNEWLNKVPDPVQPASSISPNSLTPHVSNSNSSDMDMSSFYTTPTKNLAALAQAAAYCDISLQPRGSAKKRWLRQAISEDHSCDSPSSRPGI